MINWLTSRSLFYNFNCSKPNGSASLFREAQFQAPQRWQRAFTKTPHHAPIYTQWSRCSWWLLWIRDPISSNAWNLVPTTASVRYTKEDFRTMTSFAWIYSSRLKLVVLNPQANGKYEDHFNATSTIVSNRTLFAVLFFRSKISFCWRQHKCRNQAAKDPLPWVGFKVPFKESGWLKGFYVYHLESH